jgi:hypothetical protein
LLLVPPEEAPVRPHVAAIHHLDSVKAWPRPRGQPSHLSPAPSRTSPGEFNLN